MNCTGINPTQNNKPRERGAARSRDSVSVRFFLLFLYIIDIVQFLEVVMHMAQAD